MASEYVWIDTIADASGDGVEVAVQGDVVILEFEGDSGNVQFDAGGRERFMKAWAEAERRAEAHDSAAAAGKGNA